MSVIKELPNNGFAPSNEAIAKHLRQQADWMEEEDAAEVRTVVMLFERMDGTIHRQVAGHPCDLARVLGLLTTAAIRGAIGDDD